jgi:hypothetical protein
VPDRDKRLPSSIPVQRDEEDTPVQPILIPFDPTAKRATVADVQRIESALAAHSEMDKVLLDGLKTTVTDVKTGQEAVRSGLDAVRTNMDSVNRTMGDVRADIAGLKPIVDQTAVVAKAKAEAETKAAVRDATDVREKRRGLIYKIAGGIAMGIVGYLMAHFGL